MTEQFIEPGRLPTKEQLLMLRAALYPGTAGIDAAKTWLASADIQRLGKASRSLLPILHKRLLSDGLSSPLLPMLKGVQRHTWYNNRRLFHHGGKAVGLLAQAGIHVMILKGAAMVIGYYHDESLRPMEDLDILVKHRDAKSAVRILLDNGWKMRVAPHTSEQHLQDGIYELAKGLAFVHPIGIHLDLHWNLTNYNIGHGADDDYWETPDESKFEGHQVKILNPSDQLLHIVVHGAPWSVISPVRWIPDAIAVLQKRPDLDWDRLVTQCHQRALSLIAYNSLRYLEEQFDGMVPSEVLNCLERRVPTLLERFEYWNITRPGPRGLHRATLSFLFDYARYSKDRSFVDKINLMPSYFKLRLGAKNFLHFLTIALKKVARYLARGAL